MVKPENLKMNPDRFYAFKSPWKASVMRLVDSIGGAFFPAKPAAIPWENVKKIAVLRLDHLGDVLLALPVLQALEQVLSHAQVDVIVGPWASDIVGLARLRSNVRTFAAAWFAREGMGQGIGSLKELLREGRYDAVIELRGDFRHILAMYGSGVKYRVGLSRTGFDFLLTHRSVHKPGLHEIQRNFDVLEQAGILFPQKPGVPRLFPGEVEERIQGEVRRKLGVSRPVLAIHAVCASSSKHWPVSHWGRLIDQLPEALDVVLVGTEGEKKGLEKIRSECKRKVFPAAGLFNLPGLAGFLKECRLFIGVDSGPAHIAAAVGTPVISLYSGTNVAGQWGPRGPRVEVLQKTPPCSPCELTVCPIGNECMRQIGVDEVLSKALGVLGPSTPGKLGGP